MSEKTAKTQDKGITNTFEQDHLLSEIKEKLFAISKDADYLAHNLTDDMDGRRLEDEEKMLIRLSCMEIIKAIQKEELYLFLANSPMDVRLNAQQRIIEIMEICDRI